MTADNTPDLRDVIVPAEELHPDRREHAEQTKHLDEYDLDRRTQLERDIVNAEQPGPSTH